MPNSNLSGATHPTVFMLAWAVAVLGCTRLWPLPLPGSPVAWPFGYLLWGLGFGLLLWAQYEFRKHGTTDSHSRPTTALVTTGPFRYSRHPVYVGIVGLMVGVGLVYDNLWPILLTIPLLVAVQGFTVVPEEAYLERTFGDAYRTYRQAVRQWL